MNLVKVSCVALAFLSCVSAYAKPQHVKTKHKKTLVVAVIDTGIDPKAFKETNFLCKRGHRDFTNTSLDDHHGHGTHISTLIDQYVKGIHPQGKTSEEFVEALASKKAKYCQVILKYYDHGGTDHENMLRMQQALRWAIDIKVDVINYSGGGAEPIDAEKALIEEALNKGIKIVAAAGNDGKQLITPHDKEIYTCDIKTHKCKPKPKPVKRTTATTPEEFMDEIFDNGPTYYPAQYDNRIIVVGSLNEVPHTYRASYSNYGSEVEYWEVGQKVLSLCLDLKLTYMTGTSQATAVRTGKIVKEMLAHKP